MVSRLRDFLLILGALFALVAGLAAIDSAFKHPADEHLAAEAGPHHCDRLDRTS